MRYSLGILAVWSTLLTAGAASASPVGDLQHLLDNAGFNTGGETGKWTPGTASALAGFAKQYDIDLGDTSKAPDEAGLGQLLATAQQKLDGAYAAYPTGSLPDQYFVGLGDANWFVANGWAQSATISKDGTNARVPIERYFQPIPQDIPQFAAAGVKVIRSQIGMDGALFFDECDYRKDGDNGALDSCYAKAYADAKANGWQKQIDLLSHFADNPVVKLYVDSVEKWNADGFHVIFVPTDYFNGVGAHFDGTDNLNNDDTPLFHAALMRDPAFRSFFPQFVAAVVSEFKRRGITNVSVQSANEPRFCSKENRTAPGPGDVDNWQKVERTEFDAIRRVAPRIGFVSTAICVATVSYFNVPSRRYTDLAKLMPFHKDLDGVTYALHIYAPQVLFLAAAQSARYQPGTVFHYPYQPLKASVAVNDEARSSVDSYNRKKPGPKLFEQVFGDIASFAKSRGVRVIVTETGIPKPQFGLPREERVALLHDVLAASRDSGVSLFYFATVGQWGLSSCKDSISVPDHRFDPAMLDMIAWGNGVADASPDAPLEPLEVRCGKPARIHTEEELAVPAGSIGFDSLLRAHIDGAKAGEDTAEFSIRGKAFKGNVTAFEIILQRPMSDAEAKALGAACPTVWVDRSYDDGKPRLRLRFDIHADTLTAPGSTCAMAHASRTNGAELKFLLTEFGALASDMRLSGDIDGLANPNLRALIEAAADGNLKVTADGSPN